MCGLRHAEGRTAHVVAQQMLPGCRQQHVGVKCERWMHMLLCFVLTTSRVAGPDARTLASACHIGCSSFALPASLRGLLTLIPGKLMAGLEPTCTLSL